MYDNVENIKIRFRPPKLPNVLRTGKSKFNTYDMFT